MSIQIPPTDKKTSSDKYQRIIDAAVHVFSQKGFFHAKVADVATHADVADGTIYLYFKNKDDLLVSIFEHSMDFFIAQAREAMTQISDPVDQLKAFVRLHLTSVQNHPELAQVLQIELRSSTRFMKEYKPEKFFDYLKIMGEIFVRGQAQGIFDASISADLITRSIFGAIDELALEWVLTKNQRHNLTDAGETLIQILLDGFRKRPTHM